MATDFLEDDMADAIIAHTEELLGEPLSLIDRKFWIGRYELDILFQDRHGGKLIVELQRGALDRYHLYKVLDYYDEFKDRHPKEFAEVMVVANLISPERKQRLAKRGINYREIPDEVIAKFVPARTPHCAMPAALATARIPVASPPVTEISSVPEWFKTYLSQFNTWVQDQTYTTLANLEFLWGKNEEYFPALVAYANHSQATFEQLMRGPAHGCLFEYKVSGDEGHLVWLFGEFELEAFDVAIRRVPSELVPLLSLGHESLDPNQFFTQRKALVWGLVRQAIKDPSFLLRLCTSLREFWCKCPEGLSFGQARYFLTLLHLCMSDIVQLTSVELYKSKAIPIGVDGHNQFITRPVKLREANDPGGVFCHLALALALPRNSIVPLWREGELVSRDFMDGAFPIVENAFEVGTDLLVNAYGSKAYAVADPSEVILQTGEVKSITLLEMPAHSFAYKVRYQDDTISFGYVSLRDGDAGNLVCDHFSTNAVQGFKDGLSHLTLEEVKKWTEADHENYDRMLTGIGGGEYALIAAIARDFFVCEEREMHYTVQSRPRGQQKSRQGIIIRYLPRFRVRYVGLREQEYRRQRVQVVGHHVCGHLRRCKTASPLQLVLAKQFNVEVPDGFTFVQPHDRGGHSRVFYRSRSALRMIYGEGIERTSEKKE